MWEYIKNILIPEDLVEHHKKSTNDGTAEGTALSWRGSTLLCAPEIPPPVDDRCRDDPQPREGPAAR
jgi:hypothetical protein